MSIEQMRAAIKRAYNNGPRWVARVDAMPDYQVLAIYTRFLDKHLLK